MGSDCSPEYFETACGQAEWNANFGDVNWPCQSEIDDAIDDEEEAPNATPNPTAAPPRILGDVNGETETPLFTTEPATSVDEVQPVRSERSYLDLSTQTPAPRVYEAALYEHNGPAIESCREYAFHRIQDWAEYHDAGVQESWTSRQYFDEAFGTAFNIAQPDASGTMAFVAEDRDGVLITPVHFNDKWKNAVEGWNRTLQEPVSSPPKVTPTIDSHYQEGTYAIAQGWSFDALDKLWDRQKELIRAIGAYHAAEKAKMEAVLEDLVRFGNTPVQAWDFMDVAFGAIHPVESITPARCRYNQLVKFAAETSADLAREATVDYARAGSGNGPEDIAEPVNGGVLDHLDDMFDRDVLLGRPGLMGDPAYDPLMGTGPMIPSRPHELILEYGFGPILTGPSNCKLGEILTKYGMNPYDFNFNPFEHRYQQGESAKVTARDMANAHYDALVSTCPKGATGQTPCDWAPAFFMESVVGAYQGNVNATEQRCLAATEDLLDTVTPGPTCPYPLPTGPTNAPPHSLRKFFAGYDCGLMLKFLDPAHPQYVGAPSTPPPSNALADFQTFWNKPYTSNVTHFRELYGSQPSQHMQKYKVMKQWVLEQGVGRMARSVADKMKFERQGRSSFDRSFADWRSRNTGPGGASTQSGSSAGFQYPDVVGGNLQEAFGKGVGTSKASFKSNGRVGNLGDDLLDVSSDIGADGNTGDYSENSVSQFLDLNTLANTTPVMPFTFSFKYITPKKEFSFLKAFGVPNSYTLAQVGPVALKAEADIIMYAKVQQLIQGIQDVDAVLPGGKRRDWLELSASVGVEGFIAMLIDLVFVKAGIKAGLLLVDVALVFARGSERRLEEFTSDAEADALLPNLAAFAGCQHGTTSNVCRGLNLFKRGGPTAGVMRIEQNWRTRFELKGLQFFVAVFVKIGLGPFAATFEKDLARTSGLKLTVPIGQEDTQVDLIAMVACDDALDVIPDVWDRSSCLIEEPFPGAP